MLTTAKQLIVYVCGFLIVPLLFFLVFQLFDTLKSYDGPGPSVWTLLSGIIAWMLLLILYLLGLAYYERGDLQGRQQAWDCPAPDTDKFWREWKTYRYAIRTPPWYQQYISPELCPQCFAIINACKLLHGSWKIFVPAQESYVLHHHGLFVTASNACKLCSLLFSTILPQSPASTRINPDRVAVATSQQTYDTCLPIRAEYKIHIFEAIGAKGQTYVQLSVPGYQCPAFPAFPS
jgi:hypothetical protein